MEKRSVSDVELSTFLDNLEWNYPPKWYIRVIAQDLQDARKELEEVKKDSVWRDLPDDVDKAVVHFRFRTGEDFYIDYTRNLPKTPKQELIDKFAEKNALAMKCANLSKEILEAFAKEYEEVMKPLDK